MRDAELVPTGALRFPLAVAAALLCGADAPGSFPGTATPPDGVPEPVLLVDDRGARSWLIEISCSRLFTCTSWLMYSFGSVLAVGS
jgi:hypothetical protein